MNNMSYGTIARTIVLAIALINQILVSTGKIPIDIEEDTIYQLLSLIATVIASVVAFWKNNSFTLPAIEGDRVKDAVKAGDVTAAEVNEFVNK